MEWQAWTVLTTLLVALGTLVYNKFPPDQVMLAALVLLWNIGILDAKAALKGFGNEGLITVGALFIVVTGVEKSNLIGRVMRRVLGQGARPAVARARMCVAAFTLSSIFNNTPIVAMLMPIIRDWTRERNLAPSKFLIPLSYATIMGGLLTMIGTSTNLLVNGILAQAGYEKFNLMAPFKVGFPMGVIGLAYMLLIGHRCLPDNKGGLFRKVREHGEDLVTAVSLAPESRFVGWTASELLKHFSVPFESLLKLRRKSQLPVMRTDQEGAASDIGERGVEVEFKEPARSMLLTDDAGIVDIFPVPAAEKIEPGDILLLSLPRDRLVDLSTQGAPHGMRIFSMHALDALGAGSEFIELVLGQQSPLLGRSVKDSAHDIEQLYHSKLMALRCQQNSSDKALDGARQVTPRMGSVLGKKAPEDGSPFRSELHAKPQFPDTFQAGDVLLVLAPTGIVLPKSDFLLVTRVAEVPTPARPWDFVPFVLFIAGLVLAACDVVPISNVSVTLSLLFVLGGWVPAAEVPRIVDVRLLVLIGASLGISEALEKSGLANGIAWLVLQAELPPWGTMALLFATTCLITEVVTNNAAAALGVRLAISIAHEMQVEPQPFCMVVMLAASTSYASPIGYQTNLMVMGPGGYSFCDFFKIGIVMDVLWLIGVCLLVHAIWPLEPIS